MDKNPQITDYEGNPLCFGEEYEEGHETCNDCFAEDACRRMHYRNKQLEDERTREVGDQLVSIRLPSQPYYPSRNTTSVNSLFDVTNNNTTSTRYTPTTYTPNSYSSNTAYNYSNSISAPTSLVVQKSQFYLDPQIKLMENPIFPNQFEGESPAVRLVKNSVLAGARMMLYEMYRGIEGALSKYLWPPSINNNDTI